MNRERREEEQGLKVLTKKERSTEQGRKCMGHMTGNTRARVVWMWRAGFPVIKIRERLLEEGVRVSRKLLYFLLRKYQLTNSL